MWVRVHTYYLLVIPKSILCLFWNSNNWWRFFKEWSFYYYYYYYCVLVAISLYYGSSVCLSIKKSRFRFSGSAYFSDKYFSASVEWTFTASNTSPERCKQGNRELPKDLPIEIRRKRRKDGIGGVNNERVGNRARYRN